LFAPDGRRLHVSEWDTLRSGGRAWMLEELQQQCRALRERFSEPITACGVSFGGPVDFVRQRVRSLHSPGWKDFELSRWVRETLELACLVENDANCGALGEYRFGAGRGAQSMVYITISTGVGAGIILNGEIWRGRDGLAGELGHVPVSDAAITCSCGGRGCLETFCSGDAIANRAKELLQRRPEGTRMAELCASTEVTARVVYQAAAEGDLAAVQIVSEAAKWLARAICFIIWGINPDKVVLGGGITAAENMFLMPVRGFVREFTASSAIGYSTEIELAQLAHYSPLYGAAAVALDLSRSR